MRGCGNTAMSSGSSSIMCTRSITWSSRQMRDASTGAGAELYQQAAQLRQDANYAEAERRLLQALELEHDCAAAHLELGLTYRDQARMEDAVDYFQLAVHFAPALVAGWL